MEMPASPSVDYPKTLQDFEQRFRTEQACLEYLCKLRWPSGFQCPACGRSHGWPVGRGSLIECAACHRQTSPTAGTIFERTRKPLSMWFRAMWWVTNQKHGISALGLKRALGLSSYQTAWMWMHKMRRAMVRPGRDCLHGEVEVDETYVGGVDRGGNRGRGAGRKAIVVIAVELLRPKGYGRIRMRSVPDVSGASLTGFIQEAVKPGSVVITDGLASYGTLNTLGYMHEARIISASRSPAHVSMPAVHRVASLLKRWLLGTLQGAVAPQHLDYYLDEYTFRFNRRKSHTRGMLFYRLLQHAVAIESTPYRKMVTYDQSPPGVVAT